MGILAVSWSALAMLSLPRSKSLFASKMIQTGDCILRVPYNVQIAPDNLLPQVKALLSAEVGLIAKLAIVILIEKKKGQDSEWSPYISHLPQPGEIYSSIFWNEDELDMIHQSLAYQETINQKAKIQKEFARILLALEQFPEIFKSITLKDFMHAYSLVVSRAWQSTCSVFLIPFADFLNHDGASDLIVLSDKDKKLSEVIADCDYAPGEQIVISLISLEELLYVLISYGKFPNATLLVDFGFTLPHNIHDQVKIFMDIPQDDILCELKLEILQKHRIPIKDWNGFNFSGNSFIIKEVRSARGKGKGLPQSLHAFARVLCCTSAKELRGLAAEASENDGRLARRPLKNRRKEIQAHQMLLSHITGLIENHDAAVKSLDSVNSPSMSEKQVLRRQMARDLLTGELRVLKSAAMWLKNYSASLVSTVHSC